MSLFAPIANRLVTPLTERLVEGVQSQLRFADTLLPGVALTAEETSAEEAISTGPLESATGGLRVDHLAKLIDRELKSFVERFESQLAEHGIEETSVNLKLDDQGDVIVDGSHPRRAEIEAILQGDPALKTAFRRSAAAAQAFQRLLDPTSTDARRLSLQYESGVAGFSAV